MSAGPTKAGKHGPLYLYSIEIIPADPGHSPYSVRRWAYSADDAHGKILESPDWCEEDDVGTVARVKS